MAVINGTDLGEIINGTDNADTIKGLGGDDTINGLDGDDLILGYDPDEMQPNTSDPYFMPSPLLGDGETNFLYGGDGNDTLDNGAADGYLYGGKGNDSLSGEYYRIGEEGAGNEDFYQISPIGSSHMYGEEGDDRLEGGVYMNGGDGNDYIKGDGEKYGGSGDDVIRGNDGIAYGGDGNDQIDAIGSAYGGAGDDFITSHTFVFTRLRSDDYPVFTTFGGGQFFGEDGNDRIIVSLDVIPDEPLDPHDGGFEGFSASDLLSGGAGNDFLFSGDGQDEVWGDDEDDILNGGDGADILRGGLDTDTFIFDNTNGVDTIVDFESNEKIDVRTLLQGVAGSLLHNQIFALGLLRLEQNGDDTNIFINKGDGEKHLAILLDYQADQMGLDNFILPNTAPLAQDDAFNGTQGVKVMGNVLSDNGYGADSDANGDPLTIVSGTYATANGSVTVAKYGTFTYTPNAGFHGVDTFEYTVQDGQGGTDVGLVSFNIAPLPLPPAPLIISGTVGNDTLFGGYGNDTIKGREGDDVLLGGTGWDRLEGNEGNDILYGGKGSDFLKGGAGADLFVIDGVTTRVDTIDDLRISKGDALQIKDILHYDPLHDVITDFVNITQSGANSILSVDADGLLNGVSFAAVATITGVTGLDVNQLYANGDLIIGHVVV